MAKPPFGGRLERVGGGPLDAALRALGRRAPHALARGLYREGERIMAASKPLVPVDTGALRSTGYVALPKIDGSRVSLEIGYGGPAGGNQQTGPFISPRSGRTVLPGQPVGYAVVVHEDLTARHTVGQAKYLEKPFLEARRGQAERIARDARSYKGPKP